MGISDCSANQQSEDIKVDILECGDSRVEFQESEEVLCEASSSSFGDSMCARDDVLSFGHEEEAQSMLSKDYPLPEACDDGTEFLGLKKKKLTDKWRRFCHPLMWRCKWLELKVKEIESQAKCYENEVKSHYESKQFDLEKSKFEGLEGKSIPFRDKTQRMTGFKRRRRKRVEETTDVAAYLSNHNLFSYAEKRKPTTLNAQYPDPDFGTGRKAMNKEDETEDDCLVSGLDCSDDYLAKVLCQIDEAQERTKSLRKRVNQFMIESQPAHTLLMPRTITRSQNDLTIQNGKEEPLMPHTTARNQREATVQIGRQRISADHTEDLLIPQAPPPPIQTSGQCLNNNSPYSSGGLRFHTILEDLLMDEPDMNDDETEAGKEKLDYFMKLINEITCVPPSEEADEEEDPAPVTK